MGYIASQEFSILYPLPQKAQLCHIFEWLFFFKIGVFFKILLNKIIVYHILVPKYTKCTISVTYVVWLPGQDSELTFFNCKL